MADTRDHFEEHAPLPEHTFYPEYTPEYPDVTFFKESFVTSREENIFQGEVPPGESDPLRDRRAEEKEKRRRESWLRWFLSSFVKAGAVLFAVVVLITNAWAKAEPGADTGKDLVKALDEHLLDPPFTPQEDYTFRELSSLWRGESNAPHRYDYDHVLILKEATCTEPGEKAYQCTECGVLLRYTITTDHVPAPAVQENATEPDCVTPGSRDDVIYCKHCNKELSRNRVSIPALGHTPGEPVTENRVEPTCTEPGSCEEVRYCTICKEEISRIAVTLEPTGHTPGEAVIETITEPTCTEPGSCEEGLFCTICGEEVSRTTVTLDPTGHTPGEPVTENRKEPTCTAEGSYEEVLYCNICSEELSRTTMTLAPTGHTQAAATTENRKEPTCTAEGGYDEVVRCATCKEELSRTHKTLAATGHKKGKAVKEKEKAATCTAKGSYDEVVYCSVCKAELSRTTKTTAALGHDYKAKVTKPTCTAKGYTTHTCSRCGDSYKDSETKALGHDYHTKVTKPTCTATGYTAHTCSRCGDSYKDTETAALGHVFPIKKDATCTCSRCGLEGITFSYSSSKNAIVCKLDAAFVSALRNAGFTKGWAFAEDSSRDVVGGWYTDASVTSSITLENTSLTPGTYRYRVVFMYYDTGQEYEARSKMKTFTVR